MHRGRPDEDDPLTLRESEVLELIRDGLTDEEVAVRLDVSPAGARYYAARVISKLGVSTRDEAARWSPPSKPGRLASAKLPLKQRLLGVRITRTKAVIVAAVVFVVGLYAYGFLFYDDGSNPSGVIDVQWLQVDPPSLDLREQPHPYAGSLIGGGEDVWRAYVVDGSGAPELALESNRLLLSPSWSSDGGKIVYPFISQGTRVGAVMGYTTVDAETFRIVSDRLYPLSVASRIPRSGERVALIDRRQGSVTPQVYVIEADGRSHQLAGLAGYASYASWSPDGAWLLLSAFAGLNAPAAGEEYYAVSPYQTKAINLGRFQLPPVWSPDSKRVAGVRGADMVLFDISRRQEINVEIGRPILTATPGQVLSMQLWSSDGRYVAFGGALIDASSGRLVAEPEDGIALTTVSPDGRWVLMTSDGSACGGGTPSSARPAPSPNRALLKEVATGRKVTLLNCTDTAYAFHQWLSPEVVLIAGVSCSTSCANPNSSLVLASVPDGRLRPLTDPAGETNAGFAVSPDGRRVLVSGKALRIFSADGALQRTIEPPAGLIVSGVSWSRDGQSFAYVVGPRVRSTIPTGAGTSGP